MKRAGIVLITGATGFVGSSLTQHLNQEGYLIRAAVRKEIDAFDPVIQQVSIGDLLPDTDWGKRLDGVDTIIHLAARVHVMRETIVDPLTEFRRTNTAVTLNLAKQAAAAGVRRFIYLSTIKVNGEVTALGRPFTADEIIVPSDPYGLSKYEAEQGLRAIAEKTGLEVVIIRPPLVYGPGVKANFQNMMNWLYNGIPLPLGSIHNQRSLVAIPNLISLISTCINHPAAANQSFLVSDDEDVSTTVLLRHLGFFLGTPARLLPVPQTLLGGSLGLLGKGAIAQRLCGSLQVDISKTHCLLDWSPPVSLDEALRKTAEAYLATKY